jgi:hypothetical protein
MSMKIPPVPDSPGTDQPNVISTPEGDNEYAPDQPLSPTLGGLEDPRGAGPDSYKEDHK